MVGLYRISNVAVFGGIGHIPHWPLCNNCNITVFFPRTGKRNCKQILLAINNLRNRRRRIRDWSDKPVLKSNHPLSSRRTPRNPGHSALSSRGLTTGPRLFRFVIPAWFHPRKYLFARGPGREQGILFQHIFTRIPNSCHSTLSSRGLTTGPRFILITNYSNLHINHAIVG